MIDNIRLKSYHLIGIARLTKAPQGPPIAIKLTVDLLYFCDILSCKFSMKGGHENEYN